MAAADFIRELQELGCDASASESAPQLAGHLVARLPFTIPVGSHIEEKITLGFVVPQDWPLTCPSGPYMTPEVLPLNTSTSEPPYGGIHAADAHQPHAGFGQGWEYWSRPYPGWGELLGEERTARTYMAHIRNLFSLI